MLQTSPILKTFDQLPWLPQGAVARLIPSTTLPPTDLITSVHLLCFSNDALLMVNHEQRGWDHPGGHKELGETPEVTLHRELSEEAAAEAERCTPLAYLQIDLSNSAVPEDYRYPVPHAYICTFIGALKKLSDFPAEFETTERRLFSPAEVRMLPWYERNSEIYELALREWARSLR